MNRIIGLFAFVVLCAGLSGCAVVSGSKNISSLSINGAFTNVQAGGSPIPLTAVVASGSSTVNWSLTYVNPCSPECGTLSTSQGTTATYTPPATAPKYGQATITVTSVLNNTAIYSFNFTIGPAVSVSIPNKFSTILAGSPGVLVNATVSFDTANAGVTWALTAGGSSCSPGCGTLTASTAPSFSATYQPPATAPTGAGDSPTITAASVTSPSKSDSFTFSITSATSLLQGSYALLLRGYYLTGSPMALAGSITADGKGNITGGEFDINNDGGITRVPAPVSGNYSLDTSFDGITRGRIVITSFTFPGSNIGIAFDFVLSADGKRGKAVESDGSAYINSGTFLQQDASALSAANPAGTYAFGLDSDAPVGGRIVEAGRMIIAASGITGGTVDRSKLGNMTPIYFNEPISAAPIASPDSSGRGTLTITAKNIPVLFAYYIVNSGQINLIEIDNGSTSGAQAGVAYAQNAPSVADTTSVMQLTGLDTAGGTGPDVLIGLLQISGTQFTLSFDENDLGVIKPPEHHVGNMSYDPTTGRGTFSDPGGFESGFMDLAVFYLYDTGKGIVIDADSYAPGPGPGLPVVNVVFSGSFTPQAAGPFNAASVNGNMIGGFGATAIPDIPDLEAAIVASGSSGTLNIMADADTLQEGNLRNQSLAGTFSITDPATGHGTMTLPAGIFGDFIPDQEPASFYIIGPNQMVVIGQQSGLLSGISFLDPD